MRARLFASTLFAFALAVIGCSSDDRPGPQEESCAPDESVECRPTLAGGEGSASGGGSPSGSQGGGGTDGDGGAPTGAPPANDAGGVLDATGVTFPPELDSGAVIPFP